MKGIRSIKYSLDKDLKDLGGIWSRIDFKTFIGSSLGITPGRIRLFNSWFRAGCLLQPSAKGIRKKRYVLRIANGGRLPVVMYEPEGLEESAPVWSTTTEEPLCCGTGPRRTGLRRFTLELWAAAWLWSSTGWDCPTRSL